MTKHIIRAAAVVALLLIGASSIARAADPRRFDYTVKSAEQGYKWTDKDKGYPARCASWTEGSGFVRAVLESHGGQLTANDVGGTFVGWNVLQVRGSVERKIDYSSHSKPVQPPCWPCGPSSEWGECEEERPDSEFSDSCDPAAETVSSDLTIEGRRLRFTFGGIGAALARCRAVKQPAQAGPDRLYEVEMSIPNGGRTLMRMGVGARERFVFRRKRGACSKLGKVGSYRCSYTEATVVVRRVA